MEHLTKLLRGSYDLQENKPEKSAYWHLQQLRSEIKQLALTEVGICLEKKEKKLLTMLLAKDINNLSNIVEDNELLEVYKTDYRKLAKKISEA